MANSWFQFKQFRIDQDKCGMKVSTDACVFGGLILKGLQSRATPLRGLDIGTGTGLLSLMLLQECPSIYMDAVEIDSDAFDQARVNFEQSPWSGRVRCYSGSIQDFTRQAQGIVQYDFIICNPPFFTGHLLTADAKRQLARHTASLSHGELFRAVSLLLAPGGLAGMLYPASEEARVDAELGVTALQTCKKIKIYPSHTKIYNRLVYILSDKMQTWDGPDYFYLRDDVKDYSNEYKALLQKFLL